MDLNIPLSHRKKWRIEIKPSLKSIKKEDRKGDFTELITFPYL